MHNNQQVAALPQLDRGSDYESERHRFESYTPHHLRLKLPATGAFLLRKHRMDSNLGRGAGVKKTRSVFSPRASAPAGGRSRCGSAQRMRGILYAAPIEIESLRQRGLFFYGNTAWIRTSVEARASRKRGAFLARGRARRQAGEAGADPRSGCAESYTPHHLRLKLPATGAFLLRQLECFRPKGRFPVDSCKIPSRCRDLFATTPSSSDRSG